MTDMEKRLCRALKMVLPLAKKNLKPETSYSDNPYKHEAEAWELSRKIEIAEATLRDAEARNEG